ncbi:MAG: transcriptional regulator, partial [Aldersonia sp.]|nr:transcriptional regulator [Aldersonia sp.]
IGAADLELEGLLLETSVISIRQRYIGAPPEMLAHAEDLATSLGYEREAADFLYARWSASSQQLDLGLASMLADRLRERTEGSDDPLIRLYAAHATGVDHWDHGRIGDSYRALVEANRILATEISANASWLQRLRRDLRVLSPAFLACMTTMHIGVEQGRPLFDEIERQMGDDRYARVVWSAFSATSASMSGDARWAERVGKIGLTDNATETFEVLGIYSVFQYWWARAMLGDAGEGVERMREIIAEIPDFGRRTGHALWLTLFSEALLDAEQLDEAAAALDRADEAIRITGQRYPEPLTRLIRAGLEHARGLSADRVSATLQASRDLATRTESTVVRQRIEQFGASHGYPLR